MRTTDGVPGGTSFGSAGPGSAAETRWTEVAFADCLDSPAAAPGQDGLA